MSELTATLDSVLDRVTASTPRVPGVVAVVTDREHNFYEGAAGERALGSGEVMTTDTVFAIFSTTKALTATACLQLIEDGSLDLDAPAREYAPAIGELQVLDGFDDDGTPRLRPPKRAITTRMLLLRTAGFGYHCFNEQYNRLAKGHGQPSVITCSRASITTPLLFDPGDRWEYGSNIDWAGQVVEGIAGKRLGAVLAERICGPLGMEDTAFDLRPDMRADGGHAPARSRRHHYGDDRPRAAGEPRGPHGRPRPVVDRPGLREVHPHVAQRRHGPRRARPPARDRRDGGAQPPRRQPRGRHAARRHSRALPRRRVLPGPAQVLVTAVHAKRGGRPDRSPRRRAGLGGTAEPVLLDRPRERHRRVLGDPDLPVCRPHLDRRLLRPGDHRLPARTGPGERLRHREAR